MIYLAGDLVKIQDGAVYSTGKLVPDWVLEKNWFVKDLEKYPLIHIDKSEDGKNAINSYISAEYIYPVLLKQEFGAYYSKKEDALKMWSYLEELGINNDYAKAGILSQFLAESAMRSNNLEEVHQNRLGMTDDEYTASVDSEVYKNFVYDGAGYGLCQWTWHSRKSGLLDMARSRGVSIGDMYLQLDFMVFEFNTSYKNTYNKLINSKSCKEASDILLFEYEAPEDQGEKQQETRKKYAEEFFKKYSLSTDDTVDPTVDPTLNVIVDSDLKLGSSGEAVKNLQIRIAQISKDYEKEIVNHSFNNGKPDGIYGNGLYNTVKRLQSELELPITGEVDHILCAILNTPFTAYYARYARLWEKLSDIHDIVKEY